MKPEVRYNGMAFVPYISRHDIAERVAELAKQIERDCAGEKPVFLCVLTGAFPFASDLFRQVDTDAEIQFVRFKSYDGTASTGTVNELMGLSESIKGRTVIVVEDIIDTGRTMHQLIERLQQEEPAQVKVATLLFKPEALLLPLQPDYVGFEIPKKFIIGYGLDIDGQARNLPDIYVLKD